MKILCETCVVRRDVREPKRQFQKSTLALGKKDQKSKLCIILMNASNRSGIKYDIANNIANVFRKFVDEGKCTISFKLPQVDLQIKADTIQLKAMLNLIRSELCPNAAETKESSTSNGKLLRAFGSTNKILEEQVTKLNITERSAIPTKGFPRTLKELTIKDIGYSQMPIGILNLSNLTQLDLSRNQIEKLPKKLGNLKLTKIILDENRLGTSNGFSRDWEWLEGDNLRKSISCLSIANNRMKFIPSSILKCVDINKLVMSSNEISRIPFAIKNLRQLKLLDLSKNNLRTLPSTIVKLQLDVIDLSSNQFETETVTQRTIRETHHSLSQDPIRAPSLLELSARTIVKKRVPYININIPVILKEIMFHSPLCANPKCEALCIDMNIQCSINIVQLNSKQKITSDNASYFPVDGPFCSNSCRHSVKQRWNL